MVSGWREKGRSQCLGRRGLGASHRNYKSTIAGIQTNTMVRDLMSGRRLVRRKLEQWRAAEKRLLTWCVNLGLKNGLSSEMRSASVSTIQIRRTIDLKWGHLRLLRINLGRAPRLLKASHSNLKSRLISSPSLIIFNLI